MPTEPPVQVILPADDGQQDAPQNVSHVPEFQRVPAPKYRHAAPSAPWPWMDFDQDAPHVEPLVPKPTDQPWSNYPQSRFGNWTPDQVKRCRMLTICKDDAPCHIHRVDVFSDGKFAKLGEKEQTREVPLDLASARKFWDDLQIPTENLRVRALFVDNITTDVLRILGQIYNIEPFFFASSANWIPSRFQENPRRGEGDHITVVLPFVRTIKNQMVDDTPAQDRPGNAPPPLAGDDDSSGSDKRHTIDTQAPLILSDEKILLQDLLAIHMVREKGMGTIISYHHSSELQKTTAKRLRSLVQRTGDSVYWSILYDKSSDPTLVFLAILWYALYEWDEALEVLYAYLTEKLEAKTADAKTSMDHTRELHKLQAHLLYYQQLLSDFRKSVKFVQETPNPAMDDDPNRKESMDLLEIETKYLLSEIERLDKQRQIQSDRLTNAMKLAFSTVTIEDSSYMKKLTEATLQDSAAMKLISYLTVIFLPANYLSSVFGMNVTEMVNANPPLPHTIVTYIESTVILTLITAWIIIAWQDQNSFHQGGSGTRQVVRRIAWPIFYTCDQLRWMLKAADERFRRRR